MLIEHIAYKRTLVSVSELNELCFQHTEFKLKIVKGLKKEISKDRNMRLEIRRIKWERSI